jgi:hypothetical protein
MEWASLPKTRRTTKARKRKRLGKRGLAVLVILLVAAAAVVSFVGYGLVYGGIVDFTFGGKSDVRQTYQLFAMSRLQPGTIDITHVFVRNTGSTGIAVIVTLHALNAVVATGYYGPYSDTANIQVYLQPGARYQLVTFYLALPLQVPTFTIRVTVGRVLDFSSITLLATSTMAPIHPTSPTTLIYTQVPASPVNYKLTYEY